MDTFFCFVYIVAQNVSMANNINFFNDILQVSAAFYVNKLLPNSGFLLSPGLCTDLVNVSIPNGIFAVLNDTFANISCNPGYQCSGLPSTLLTDCNGVIPRNCCTPSESFCARSHFALCLPLTLLFYSSVGHFYRNSVFIKKFTSFAQLILLDD